jgi:transposase
MGAANQRRMFVERLFNKLKQLKGIKARSDKASINLLAAVKLAALRVWATSLLSRWTKRIQTKPVFS